MKIIATAAILILLTSCNRVYTQELEKTIKSGAASSRISSSQQNNDSLFNEID